MKPYRRLLSICLLGATLSACTHKKSDTTIVTDSLVQDSVVAEKPTSDETKDEEIDLDSILVITKADTISEEMLKKNAFAIGGDIFDNENSIFIPIRRERVIVRLKADGYKPGSDRPVIINPFSGERYDTLLIQDRCRHAINEYASHGVSSENLFFLRNNNGDLKGLMTDDWGEHATYSIGDALSNGKKQVDILRLNKKCPDTIRLDFNDLKNLYVDAKAAEGNIPMRYLYWNKQLFEPGEITLFEIFRDNVLLLRSDSMATTFYHGEKVLTLPGWDWPVANRIFYADCGESNISLWSLNMITGEAKKYILPPGSVHLYFSNDGLFVRENFDEDKASGDSEEVTLRYAFVPY